MWKKSHALLTTERTDDEELTSCRQIAVATVYSAGCSVASGQTSVGDVVDDSTITTQVKTRFVEDKIVSANRINVETLKGVVQLSGFATTEAERTRAAEIAAAVPGVEQVQNAITVRPV